MRMRVLAGAVLFLVLAIVGIVSASRILEGVYMRQAVNENDNLRILVVPVGVTDRSRSIPPPRLLEDLVAQLRLSLSVDYEITKAVMLPNQSYDAERRQVEGNSALATLIARFRESPSFRILFVTEEDLYIAGLNFVFGLAAPGGRAAIVSDARFKERRPGFADPEGKLHLERLTKVAVHELGHTLLLQHSEDPRSVMKYRNSLAELDNSGGRFTSEDVKSILERFPQLEGKVR